MDREQVIAFFYADEDFCIDVRFASFTMAPCKKIIISNPPPASLLPEDTSGAIRRRFVDFQITEPTWLAPAGLPTPYSHAAHATPHPTTPSPFTPATM